jgi:hypothetical protein
MSSCSRDGWLAAGCFPSPDDDRPRRGPDPVPTRPVRIVRWCTSEPSCDDHGRACDPPGTMTPGRRPSLHHWYTARPIQRGGPATRRAGRREAAGPMLTCRSRRRPRARPPATVQLPPRRLRTGGRPAPRRAPRSRRLLGGSPVSSTLLHGLRASVSLDNPLSPRGRLLCSRGSLGPPVWGVRPHVIDAAAVPPGRPPSVAIWPSPSVRRHLAVATRGTDERPGRDGTWPGVSDGTPGPRDGWACFRSGPQPASAGASGPTTPPALTTARRSR